MARGKILVLAIPELPFALVVERNDALADDYEASVDAPATFVVAGTDMDAPDRMAVVPRVGRLSIVGHHSLSFGVESSRTFENS